MGSQSGSLIWNAIDTPYSIPYTGQGPIEQTPPKSKESITKGPRKALRKKLPEISGVVHETL